MKSRNRINENESNLFLKSSKSKFLTSEFKRGPLRRKANAVSVHEAPLRKWRETIMGRRPTGTYHHCKCSYFRGVIRLFKLVIAQEQLPNQPDRTNYEGRNYEGNKNRCIKTWKK
jgi:hypothetical protein